MKKQEVFISSVQKELENERIAVSEIITTDPFLSENFKPVLYEYEPAYPQKAIVDALEYVEGSDIFLILIGNEYGNIHNGISIIHHEYNKAQELGLSTLVYLKGDDTKREKDLKDNLLKAIKNDGYKYKRFKNYKELQSEVRASLVKILKKEFKIIPSEDENIVAEQTIEATSSFGVKKINLCWKELNFDLARQLVQGAEKIPIEKLSKPVLKKSLLSRGLLWTNPETNEDYATAAAVVLLADNLDRVLPHCSIFADAYRGTKENISPYDSEKIYEPLPKAIDRAVEFVQRNTRHPIRIVGLNRVQLNEYPIEALREAIVNATAHRNYELDGQKIFLKIFSDHLIISSPGLPPKPITLSKIRSGKYKPCSRNPIIAYNLSFFHRIEERGSGIGRIKDVMQDHGLDAPIFDCNNGFFEVTLPGPGKNMNRLKVALNNVQDAILPSIQEKLNSRQKRMIMLL